MNAADHKAEAEEALAKSDMDVSRNMEALTGELKADVLALAQVHATLALVEQQRIANLLTHRERLVTLGTSAAYWRLEKLDALVEEGLDLA